MYLFERKFKAAARHKAAKEGAAMKDGSFPIYNKKDLKNAIKLAGHSKHGKAAAMAHIRKRAKALGLSMNEDLRNSLLNIIEAVVSSFTKPSIFTGQGRSEMDELLTDVADSSASRPAQKKAEPVVHKFFLVGRGAQGDVRTGFPDQETATKALTDFQAEKGHVASKIVSAEPRIKTTTVSKLKESLQELDEHIESLVNKLNEADQFNPEAVMSLFVDWKQQPAAKLIPKPDSKSFIDKMKDDKGKGKGTPPPPPAVAPLQTNEK